MALANIIRIALVDGDPAVRHARQLMLRAEGFEVRAYATSVPLLADPLARASDCIVADVETVKVGGVVMVRKLRELGWTGAAILLTNTGSAALMALAVEHGFRMMSPAGLSDRLLLEGVRQAVGRQCSSPTTSVLRRSPK